MEFNKMKVGRELAVLQSAEAQQLYILITAEQPSVTHFALRDLIAGTV